MLKSSILRLVFFPWFSLFRVFFGLVFFRAFELQSLCLFLLFASHMQRSGAKRKMRYVQPYFSDSTRSVHPKEPLVSICKHYYRRGVRWLGSMF